MALHKKTRFHMGRWTVTFIRGSKYRWGHTTGSMGCPWFVMTYIRRTKHRGARRRPSIERV